MRARDSPIYQLESVVCCGFLCPRSPHQWLSSIKNIKNSFPHALTLWFSSYVGPVWLTLPRREERHVKQHLLLLSQVPTLQRTPHSGNRSNCTCHSSFSMIFLLYGFREISTKSQVQQVFWNFSLQILQPYIEPAVHVRSGSEMHGVYSIKIHCLSWFNFFVFSGNICLLQTGWRPQG